MDRVVGHLDLDYFYAQVEEVENPSIKSKPVVVCVYSGRTQDSGVVATANYRARELGVKSGIPISLAQKKLKDSGGVFLRMAHEKYEKASERVMEIVEENVDVLEKSSIDEAFFDLTKRSGGDYGSAWTAAAQIKGAILQAEGLTCSIGLGRSKTVAKIASDSQKPDGLTVVLPDSTDSFMSPLPVTRISGIGPKTAATLEEIGVRTIGDLARVGLVLLEEKFGRKNGVFLHEAATGTDAYPVVPSGEATQLSRIITLKRNTRDADEAMRELAPAIENLHQRLVSRGSSFRTISVIGIFEDLSTRSKSRSYENPISELSLLKGQAARLVRELTESSVKDLRRVGVRVSDLSTSKDQTSLAQFQTGE